MGYVHDAIVGVTYFFRLSQIIVRNMKKTNKPSGVQTLHRSLPPLNMLRSFEAVARHKNVTLAAQELSVTQSAVSHQIKSLEKWLGQPLLQRDGRNIRLTLVGESFYPSITEALDKIELASLAVRRKNQGGIIRLSAFSTFTTYWLIPRVELFCEVHPDTEVQLITSGTSYDFDPRSYDLAIRNYSDEEVSFLRGDKRWSEVEMSPFLSEYQTVVCSPELMVGKNALREVRDIRRHTLLASRSTPFAWTQWLERSEIPPGEWPRKQMQFDHIHLALNAALQGVGLALAAPSIIRSVIRDGRLIIPFPQMVIARKRNYWIRPRNRALPPEIDAFCRWLSDAGHASEVDASPENTDSSRFAGKTGFNLQKETVRE